MCRRLQALLFLLLCVKGSIGSENDCKRYPAKDCDKEILWLWYTIICVPFQKANEILLMIAHEKEKENKRMLEVDEAIKTLGLEQHGFRNVFGLRSSLERQRKILCDLLDMYNKLEKNIIENIEEMKVVTRTEGYSIELVGKVVESVWSIYGHVGTRFEDLNNIFEKIRKSGNDKRYEEYAKEVVDNAVRNVDTSVDLNYALAKLLDNVTERYKNKVDVAARALLSDPKEWIKEAIRNFMLTLRVVESQTETIVVGGKNKTEILAEFENTDKEVGAHILRMVSQVRSKHCGDFGRWSELRKDVKVNEQIQRFEMRSITDDIRLVESALVSELQRAEKTREGGKRARVWQGTEMGNVTSLILEKLKGSLSQMNAERREKIQQLRENASASLAEVTKVIGPRDICGGLAVESKLMDGIFADVSQNGINSLDSICDDSFSDCDEKNSSMLLRVLKFLTKRGAEGSNIEMAIAFEESVFQKQKRTAHELLTEAKNVLETYKKVLVNDINYLRNGTCAVQESIAEDFLKLKGLKRQLHQAREEINVLRSGASMQSACEDEETDSVTLEAGEHEGFLVLQGKSVLKSSALPEQAVNGNVSTRVSALLEQAEHFDGSGARGAGCAVWTGSKADLTAEQLVANLTGEIGVHDVLLEVHVNILRRVARGERLLASLRDAKKKLEGEIEEARKGEQCEPLWRQLLRLVRG
ncbi:hypothetical protein ERJ75_000473800 [Trypanosoma vivax]|nr:hypothetical protein ERJ75_000473800 [Trypanosoma vivax]